MKLKLVLIVLLLTQIISAQEPFLSFDHYLGENAKKPKQLFSTYIEETESFLVFIEDKKQLHVYEFDKTGKEMRQGFSLPNVAKKLPNIAGYAIDNGKYIAYLSTANKRSWAILTLDFTSKTHTLQEVTQKIEQDRIMQSALHANHLYVFTVVRNSSIINMHKISPQGNITKSKHNFEDLVLNDGKRTLAKIDNIMQIAGSREATFIDSSVPIALESSKSRVKIYQKDEFISLTLDHSAKRTFLLTFNLTEGTSKTQIIEKTALNNDSYKARSNSFLIDEKLFMFNSSVEEMNFSVVDIKTSKQEVIYSATKDEIIKFKNTPIIQEDEGRDNSKEFEKTAKFLRKISSSNLAITVVKNDTDYVITLGASAPSPAGGPVIIAAIGGGLGGAVLSGIITGIANASTYQYSAYKNTRSTRFQLILDQDFKFDGSKEIPVNSFDDIKGFTQDTPPQILQTICKVNDLHIWGALNNKNNKINFFNF